MRAMTGSTLVIAATLAASPVRAQMYDPTYPICLQTFGIMGNAISCGYTSMEVCQATARSRAAQCIVNPYFVGAPRKSRVRRSY